MGNSLVAALLAVTLCVTGGVRFIPPAGALESEPVTGGFQTRDGAVVREERTVEEENAALDMRTYTYPDGATVTMERVRTTGETGARSLGVIELAVKDATMRRYAIEEDKWYISTLREGTITRGMFFFEAGDSECLIVTPQVYIDRENGTIEHLTQYDGTLEVTRTETGFRIETWLPALPAGLHAEYLLVQSARPLVDWTNKESVDKWGNYRLTDANRWCYDGYYYLSEKTYYPTGDSYFSNLPAAYITGKMMRDVKEPASRILGLAMLDVMRAQWNDEGYIPSLSGSEWLRDDYGIQPGYYDTRFNTDLALAYLNAAENFGVLEWLPIVERYADFVERHAQENHFTFGSGENEGWLIQDYSQAGGGYTPTHASLNHHASIAVFFYRLAASTANESRADFADRLVRGIEQTGKKWLMKSGDLHYAYLPDGTMGLLDYPNLTYNDLFELQRLIKKRYGKKNAEITRLLDSKRAYMIKNRVTGYAK